MNETWVDPTTGLMWKAAPEPGRYTWAEACALTSDTGGFTDWRLPTISELLTLVDYQNYSPACKIGDCPSSYFWSGSSYVLTPTLAWFVYFFDGYTYAYTKTYHYYVRLVRGGLEPKP